MNDEVLNKSIKNYFDNEIPEPDDAELEKLKYQLRTQKAKNTKLQTFKKFALAMAVLLILIPSIALPIVLKKEDQHFYRDDELEKIDLQYEDAKNIISNNYSEYLGVFDICDLVNAHGYYADNNKLISIDYSFVKTNLPFITLTLQIDLTNYYDNANKSKYKYMANVKNDSNYTLYEKEVETNLDKAYLKLLEFKDHTVYLNLNVEDSDILDIFIWVWPFFNVQQHYMLEVY